MFTLANDAPAIKPLQFSNNLGRLRVLLAGLDALPGQGDLFATDGVLPEVTTEPTQVKPMNDYIRYEVFFAATGYTSSTVVYAASADHARELVESRQNCVLVTSVRRAT